MCYMYLQYTNEGQQENTEDRTNDLESMSDEEFNRRREECMKQQYGDG